MNYNPLSASFSRYQRQADKWENYMKQIRKRSILLDKTFGGLTIVPSVAEALQRQTLQLERILYPTQEISRNIEQIRHAVVYPIAEVNQSIEQVRRTIANVTQPLAETARWLQNTFPATDLIERWRSIHIIASTHLLSGWVQYTQWIEKHLRPLGERLRLLPFYLAWQALEEGDRETVDHFLAEWCGMPNLPKEDKEEAYKALWNVLRREKWKYLADPEEYIKTAVWRTVKLRRLQREIEFSGGGATDLLFRDFQERGLELVSLDDLLEGEGRLWIPAKDDTQSVEDRLFIEWVLSYLRDPSDRKAILAYCRGYAETLREAFGGDKNRQDVARRRLRKLAEQLRPLLFN